MDMPVHCVAAANCALFPKDAKQVYCNPILCCTCSGGEAAAGSLQDYSSKLLRYVAASPGQEFMTQLELRRPKPADEDAAAAEEGRQPEQVPVTFKILDEHMPLLEVRN